MKKLLRLATLAGILALLAPALRAQVPQIVNYQGRVAVGTVNFNGPGQFKFALVNAAGTTTFWSNDNTSVAGASPIAALPLTVTKGLYSVLLGDTAITGMPTAIPSSVWTNADVRLRVWFNDGTNGFQLLTPDQRLAPNGYLPDGSVSSAVLAGGAVTSAKLAANAVQAGNLADGAITSAKIAGGAVGSAQLAATVPLLSNNQAFSGQNTFNNPANSFIGSSFALGSGAGLSTNQGGSLELGDSLQTGATPFIDFHYGTGAAEDYNVRLINDGAGRLSLYGDLNVSGAITANNLFVNGGVIQTGSASLPTADLGLYSQTSGNYMRFVTNAAPFHWFTDSGIGTTPRMSLTSDGNLGIGTAAPAAKLDVVGDIRATTGAFSSSISASSASIPTLNGNVSVGGALTTTGVAVLGAGELYFSGFSSPRQIRSGDNNHRILFRNSENKMEFREYGDLLFSPGATAGAETAKVVMQAGGNVGIGTTAPTATLDVNGGIKGITGAFSNSITASSASLSGALNATSGNFTGALSATSGTFTSPISAPSATIPTLSGNVTVGGEVTANVVTVLGGSDVAEPYEVASAGETAPVPGMVVAIDSAHVGRMRVAARAYDKTVAGILSGANGIAPGITLRQKGTVADGSLPVASIGRVWCWCDADANGPIEAGDMLTTSDTPGHAMKVTDFAPANGATIGKAMSSLASGRGMVLVLVSLK